MSGDVDVPAQHQIRIAKDTLKMSDVGARIMGGMTKEEAREILKKHGIKYTESNEEEGYMKATEVTEGIDLFLEDVNLEEDDDLDGLDEHIIPAILKVTRAGGGSYSVESGPDYTQGDRVAATFADYPALKEWLLVMRAFDIPEAKLNLPDVNVEVPIDMVMLQYAGNYNKDAGLGK